MTETNSDVGDVLRFHERLEARNRVLNPLSAAKLDLLGRICVPGEGARVLDLASGKGEMLCRWARDLGIRGTGVDLSPVFTADARARAEEFGVADRVGFVEQDAASYEAGAGSFDVVSCLGATWIGGGLSGTLELMAPALAGGGTMLVGEVFWHGEPSQGALEAHRMARGEYTDLAGTVDRITAAGFETVEMVLASPDDWDRYMGPQWWAGHEWLRANPGHPDEEAMRAFLRSGRDAYLGFGRAEMGWGVFVLRR